LWGKHKIAPLVSPNKTWQGLVGGVVVSVLTSVLLGRYLQLADGVFLGALGLLLSLVGFAGDLLFSSAKRWLGIKDFSQLIAGHGGILDRVDSLVLTAPLLYFAIPFHKAMHGTFTAVSLASF
jgi:phosphatidate cytidylyltransferase